MQLAKLNTISAELDRNAAKLQLANTRTLHFFKDKWWDQVGNDVTAELDSSRSQQALTAKAPWRERSSLRVYFPLVEYAAVFVADFQVRPRADKSKRVFSELLDLVKHGANEFAARHKPLTGLPNEATLDEVLERSVSKSTPGAGPAAIAASASPAVSTVLLSADVDGFKQVNDNYTHTYGDVVLRTVARRLQDRLPSSVRELGLAGRVDAFLANPGGEEFLVVLHGHVNVPLAAAIAEDLRSAIHQGSLPNDEEWDLFGRREGIPDDLLPPLTDRHVTLSVGVSGTTSESARRQPKVAAQRLRAEADAAMYRAKATPGKNCICVFSEILSKHGTILEHHEATGIVAIDIGSSVRMVPGQRFKVYNPDFSGNRPFLTNDGRSIRRVGTYPRHSTGEIIAFAVQSEIAFCRVLRNDVDRSFVTGSKLEAIPLGSLPEISSEGGGAVTPADLVPAALDSLAANGLQPLVLVVALGGDSALVAERDQRLSERLVREVTRAAMDVLGIEAVTAELGGAQAAIITSAASVSDAESKLNRLLGAVHVRMGPATVLHIGAYFEASYRAPHRSYDRSELRADTALDYARYALALLRDVPESTGRFLDALSVGKLIKIAGDSGAAETALADYARLRQLGIKNSRVENNAAIVFRNRKEEAATLSAAREALRLEPESPIIAANLAVAEYDFGSPVEAGKIFKQALDLGLDVEGDKTFVTYAAAALYEGWKVNRSDVKLRDAALRLTQMAQKYLIAEQGQVPPDLQWLIQREGELKASAGGALP